MAVVRGSDRRGRPARIDYRFIQFTYFRTSGTFGKCRGEHRTTNRAHSPIPPRGSGGRTAIGGRRVNCHNPGDKLGSGQQRAESANDRLIAASGWLTRDAS